MLCPPKTAHRLAQHWTDAELRIVPYAGHTATEPEIKTALIEALKDFCQKKLCLLKASKQKLY